MGKKLLFVVGEKNFATSAIAKNLEEDLFDVIQLEPLSEEVEKHADEADIILFYLSNYLKTMLRTLDTVVDICRKQHKTLCLAGEPLGLDAAEENADPKVVDRIYRRPVDIRQLVADMNGFVGAHSDRRAGKVILLVDDDPDFLKLASGWLRNLARVDVASSGEQALEYLEDHRPDLILLDYNMPEMNGSEVMDEVRKRPRVATVPIIFLTGRNDRAGVMEVLKKRPEGYILKSMSRDEVLQILNDFFAWYFLKRKGR